MDYKKNSELIEKFAKEEKIPVSKTFSYLKTEFIDGNIDKLGLLEEYCISLIIEFKHRNEALCGGLNILCDQSSKQGHIDTNLIEGTLLAVGKAFGKSIELGEKIIHYL